MLLSMVWWGYLIFYNWVIIHFEFINNLSPLEIGFISSIRDAGMHGSMLLGSNNAAREGGGVGYSEPCQTSKIDFFAEIVNG